MLIELLRQTSIRGRAVKPGDVVEAADPDARYLLATGKAQAVEQLERPTPADEPNPAAVPAPEVRKPRPRKPRA